MDTFIVTQKTNQRFNRALVLAISIVSLLVVASCGTKVYNVKKTIVYDGAIYNVSDVNQITAIITGKISDERTVNLRGADRKQIEAYISETGSIYTRMSFDLDGQEMLYRASSVENWSQYSRMRKSFEGAGKNITKLLAAKKTTQLKLKQLICKGSKLVSVEHTDLQYSYEFTQFMNAKLRVGCMNCTSEELPFKYYPEPGTYHDPRGWVFYVRWQQFFR